MTEPIESRVQEDRFLRIVSTGHSNVDAGLQWATVTWHREFVMARDVQVVADEQPGGTWTVVISGAFIDQPDAGGTS